MWVCSLVQRRFYRTKYLSGVDTSHVIDTVFTLKRQRSPWKFVVEIQKPNGRNMIKWDLRLNISHPWTTEIKSIHVYLKELKEINNSHLYSQQLHMSRGPLHAWIFSGFLFATAKVASITAMVFFTLNYSSRSSNIWNSYIHQFKKSYICRPDVCRKLPPSHFHDRYLCDTLSPTDNLTQFWKR